jgi:hypothetical protein
VHLVELLAQVVQVAVALEHQLTQLETLELKI